MAIISPETEVQSNQVLYHRWNHLRRNFFQRLFKKIKEFVRIDMISTKHIFYIYLWRKRFHLERCRLTYNNKQRWSREGRNSQKETTYVMISNLLGLRNDKTSHFSQMGWCNSMSLSYGSWKSFYCYFYERRLFFYNQGHSLVFDSKFDGAKFDIHRLPSVPLRPW